MLENLLTRFHFVIAKKVFASIAFENQIKRFHEGRRRIKGKFKLKKLFFWIKLKVLSSADLVKAYCKLIKLPLDSIDPRHKKLFSFHLLFVELNQSNPFSHRWDKNLQSKQVFVYFLI